MEYLADAWQRMILTWDVLRERGDEYLEHEVSNKPPVLVFDYEMVIDGRQLPRPANYALVRIKPQADHPPTDREQAPVRGHRSAGRARPGHRRLQDRQRDRHRAKQGHPCYFVMFFPQPVPGQTIESVCAAEGVFLRKVNELHPHAEGARS